MILDSIHVQVCQMRTSAATNATAYQQALEAACTQLVRGTNPQDIAAAARALRALNPSHALLPMLEARARQFQARISSGEATPPKKEGTPASTEARPGV